MINKETSRRVYQIIKHLGTTQKDFGKTIGIQQSNMSAIVNGHKECSEKLIDKIVTIFGISRKWLLEGEGQMLMKEEIIAEEERMLKGSITYYPLVNLEKRGVFFFEDPYIKTVKMEILGFSNCIAFEAQGDSMDPKIKSGNIVILKEWKKRTFNKQYIYFISTEKGDCLIRYIHPSNKEGKILCVSENPNFKSIEMDKQDIHKIFVLKGQVLRNYL